MKKITKIAVLIFCSMIFSAYAGNTATTVKKDETVKTVKSTKKVLKTTSSRNIPDKWKNWSKIKELFK